MEEILINLLTQYPIASTIIVVLAALHPVASAITALTETPKDDGIVAKIYKVIEWLALIIIGAVLVVCVGFILRVWLYG